MKMPTLRAGLALAFTAIPCLAAPLRHASSDVRLTLYQVSEHTLEIRLQQAQVAGFQLPADVSQPGLTRKPLWQGETLDAPVTIPFGGYQIELTGAPLRLTARDAGGRVVQSLGWEAGSGELRFATDAPIFGLGEGGPGYDRRGEVFSLKDGWGGYQRRTHGSRIAVPYLVSPAGWALMLNHLPGQAGTIDLRQGKFLPDAGQAALPFAAFLTLAADPLALVAERATIEGHAPLPPLWALGYMQSHRTLAGPDQILEVARNFRAKNLPCDALIYLGTGYCPAGWNRGHGSLEFNPATFPQPRQMLDQLHQLGFKVVLHINNPPENLHGTTLDADDPASIGTLWNAHLPAFALGVDGWWPDDGDPLGTTARIARHRLYAIGPRHERPNERPWALHRTGYLGTQQFGGWIWSGDPDSTWETLRTQVRVGLNHSVSLSPFWGSDTGGFIPTAELTPELYLRWFQFSCFTASFRSHGRAWQLRLPWGWNTGTLGPIESDNHVSSLPAVEDTHNPGVEPICKKYLELRYRLLSHNYALAREAATLGLPMMRPLWMHAPGEPAALARADEFFWGANLLVAPVMEKGATTRTLYLPAGEWFDFWTNKRVAGARELTRPADLATLPLYVRAGTILPLDPVRQTTSEKSQQPLTLRVYPGCDATFTLYQDDGRSLDYQNGACRSTRIHWNDTTRTLSIQPEKSTYQPGWPTQLTVEVAGLPAQTLPWDGSATEIKIP